jgi:hypothetical protein
VFREAGMQVSPVTMSRPSPEPLFLPVCAVYKSKALWFGLFGVGRFWKGKELLKGKELQGNC